MERNTIALFLIRYSSSRGRLQQQYCVLYLYFTIFLSAFRSVIGKDVTLKPTSLVKSGQMLSAAGELRKFKRIHKPSKLRCFTLAQNSKLKIAITNYV